MQVCAAQNPTYWVYWYLSLLRCVGKILGPLHGADPAGNTRALDVLAFSLIIFVAKRSAKPGLGFPSLLEVIARDATLYSLVIFTAHLVLEITLIFTRVGAAVSLLGCG